MSEDPILAALARMDERLSRMDERMDARLSAMGARIGRIDATLEALDRNVDKLRGETGGWMERIENRLTAIREDIVVNLGATHAVRRIGGNTRDELRDLGDTVAALHQKLVRLQTQVDDMGGKAAT